MRATARLELAKLHAERGDLLSAAAIARSVPNQFPGVIVGRFSGEESYYGSVETICMLESARFSILSGQYNRAMLLLLDLIRGHPGEQIGALAMKLDLEYMAVRMANEAITKMPASESKRIALYEELQDACRGKLAKAKLLFFRAEQWMKTYRKLGNLQRIDDALAEYRKVLSQFPDVIEPTVDNEMLLSVAAIRQIRKLFIVEAKDPKRALYELSRIEQEYEKKETPEAKTIAAYARYYNAMVSYQNMKNYRQAIYDLEILLEKYPGVMEYPSPRGEKTKFPLERHIRKVIEEIREKNV
jgi:tetratricopeptide (TPR) repeat protein